MDYQKLLLSFVSYRNIEVRVSLNRQIVSSGVFTLIWSLDFIYFSAINSGVQGPP